MFKTCIILILLISSFAQSTDQESQPLNQAKQPFNRNTFSLNTFSLLGNWQILDTNCSDILQCRPQVSIVNNSNVPNGILITVAFPNSTNCNGHTTFTVPEVPFFGMFNDTNTSSPIYGASAILNLNNNTVQLLRQPISNQSNQSTNNQSQMCQDVWGGPNTIQTNQSSVGLLQNFSNSWTLFNFVSLNSSVQCCLPESPVLLLVTPNISMVDLIWRFPDCEACGLFEGQVVVRENISNQYGVMMDVEDNNLRLYEIDAETVISVDQRCAAVWIPTPPIKGCQYISANNQCSNSGMNSSSSNTSVNGGGR